MSYSHYSNGGSFNPANGFSSRPKAGNAKRLSVALPPKVASMNDLQPELPTPRTTSRSHLLAGLRTAPKPSTSPVSAPYNQSRHQYNHQQTNQWTAPQLHPQTSIGTTFHNSSQYAMQAAQQTYALPEQILAPPSMFDDMDDMDPSELEQLQLTSLYLAQRQQQLQQQLASITAASQQFQGLGMYQSHASMMNLGQQATIEPIEVPGQPGLYVVQNPMTGQLQYVQAAVQQSQQPPRQRALSPLGRSQTMQNLNVNAANQQPRPIFRAEISPPPTDKPNPFTGRSITPPEKSKSPPSGLDHVEPLPPPSANAFRRGHSKKLSSLSLVAGNQVAEGPKTASAATFGSTRQFIPPTPMTGTFGPGAARAGSHPVRQPRGPPAIEELNALPTANHAGSKNFAARNGRDVATSLARAGSGRRGVSNPVVSTSPISESAASLNSSEEDAPGLYRKQSPIGSERSAKRGSQSSDGSPSGSTVQTPATEDNNMFDMQSFVKQLPMHVQQHGQERRKMMLGVLSAAEKRKSMY